MPRLNEGQSIIIRLLLLGLFLGNVLGKELYLLGLFPMSGSWPGGRGHLPAVELAIRDINNSTTLPGYELVLIPKDTECNGGVGTNELFKELYNFSMTKIAVLGGGCSLVTQPTAQASHLWNLIQLSYASASPLLSDRSLHPKFFRVFPPETVLNKVRFAMLQYFEWKKVATLHETVDLFSLATADFLNEVDNYGIEVLTSESFASDPSFQVANIKRQGARIIIGNFYENKARQVFCAAYKEGMYGARYVWIITGWYSSGWWKTLGDHDCTLEEMEAATTGYFTTDALPLSLSAEPGLAGKTTSEFLEEYIDYVGGAEIYDNLAGSQEAPYGYDSVWSFALMFNKSREQLMNSLGKDLSDFSYDDTDMVDIMMDIMSNLTFLGVSGPVRFTDTGDREGLMQVEQNQNGTEKRVGVFDPSVEPSSGGQLTWTNDPSIIWEGGRPPPDSVEEVEVTVSVTSSLFYCMASLAGIGILATFGFLYFNIKYRKRRFIKMSSPNMNNAILIGCLLSFLSIILGGLDTGLVSQVSTLGLCKTYTWTLTVGFSLAFGAMFSKTYRVHRVFTNKHKLTKTVIKDYQLFGMVGVLVLVDFLILSLWEGIDPLILVTKYGEEKVDPDNEDRILKEVYLQCNSSKKAYWLGSLYAIKGILLIFGAFLAWETRKVSVPGLNDSKYIGISVYNVVILSFIGVAVSLILSDKLDEAYAIVSIFIFFATIMTECLVFVPKIMIRNNLTSNGGMFAMSTVRGVSEDGFSKGDSDDKQVASLKEELKELQDKLKTRDNRITEMEERKIRPKTISNQLELTSTTTCTDISAKKLPAINKGEVSEILSQKS